MKKLNSNMIIVLNNITTKKINRLLLYKIGVIETDRLFIKAI